MPLTHRIGPVEVVALEDGVGPFYSPRQEAFPEATDELWRRADAFDPGAAGDDGRWMLRFRCFAIRRDSGGTILVDTGIGPVGSFAAAWAPVPGRLPEELAAAGIAAADVSTVVLTHLHTDHIGWSVVPGDGDELRAYFGNARYVLQRAEYDAVDERRPQLRTRLLDPLRDSGQLHLVDGGTTRLAPGVSTVATPGHTPGHQCVLLDAAGERLVVTGDLLVHALQLLEPAQPYALETDKEQARQSRERVLRELAEAGGVLATAHLGRAFHPHRPDRTRTG